MTITVSAILYCLTILYILFRYRQAHKIFVFFVLILCFLEICFFQGYFFKVGYTEYSICHMHRFGMVLYTVMYLSSCGFKIKREAFIWFTIFLFVPLLTLAVQFVFPYEGMVMPGWLTGAEFHSSGWDNYVAGLCSLQKYEFPALVVGSAIRGLLVFAIIVLGIKEFITKNDLLWICRCLLRGSVWITVYGYIEFFMKNLFGLGAYTYDFTRVVFGVGAATCDSLERVLMSNGLYRLHGFTREPAHFALSLFFFSLLILIYKKIHVVHNGEIIYEKKYDLLLPANILLMFMTGGMSSVWLVSIVLGAYIVINYFPQKVSIVAIIKFAFCSLIAIICSLCLIWFLMENSDIPIFNRLKNAFDTVIMLADGAGAYGLNLDGSTLARFTGIIVCLGNWLDRPLLGLGLCSTWCHDTTAVMLVQFGLIGTFVWYKFITVKTFDINNYDHILFLLVILINGILINSVPSQFGYTTVTCVILAELTTIYNDRSCINKFLDRQ